MCPHGPAAATATRRCTGDYNSGASWDDLEESACNFNNKRTSELNKLSEVTFSTSCILGVEGKPLVFARHIHSILEESFSLCRYISTIADTILVLKVCIDCR